MPAIADSIRFVHEGDLLRIAGIPRSTWQNWARHGLVADPPDGRFRETDVVATVVVAQLVQILRRLSEVERIWRAQGLDVLAAILRDRDSDGLILVLEPRLLRLTIGSSRDAAGEMMRAFEPAVLLPTGAAADEARTAFWRLVATRPQRQDARRRIVRRGTVGNAA
jgi:hypothetical protein